MTKCKHYCKHLETIYEYIECLYKLESCGAGGLLHILTDDDNYRDCDILYCLSECIRHPEREESQLGRLICEEYLRLPIEQRRLLSSLYAGHWTCRGNGECSKCEIETGGGDDIMW